jgi:hypothetical protein
VHRCNSTVTTVHVDTDQGHIRTMDTIQTPIGSSIHCKEYLPMPRYPCTEEGIDNVNGTLIVVGTHECTQRTSSLVFTGYTAYLFQCSNAFRNKTHETCVYSHITVLR